MGDDTRSASKIYPMNIEEVILELCSGTSKEEISLRNCLYSEEIVCGLLRAESLIELLNKNIEYSVTVVKAIIRFSVTPWDIAENLTCNILSSSFPLKEEFKQFLWSQKDAVDFPPSFSKLVLLNNLNYLESYLLNIYQNDNHLKEDLWDLKRNRWLITWCSHSHEAFVICSKLLHQFLFYSKYKNIILEIIKKFIKNVGSECEKRGRDFVLLYPLKYQCLVAQLILEPKFNPNKEKLVGKLRSIEKNDPNIALLLYSHFPSWILL